MNKTGQQELQYSYQTEKDFKMKAVKKDKEGHHLMVKRSTQEENTTVVNIYVSFALRWVSCSRLKVFAFWSNLALCLLIGAFRPLTFKVIIDRYVFISILTLISSWFYVSLPFFFGFDGFHLFYAWVLFFTVFVNVVFGFDLWLPCFSSMLIRSSMC